MKIFVYGITTIFLTVFIVQSVRSQTKVSNHEIVLQNDNDVYLFTAQDRYYTNGININYRIGLKLDTTKVKNRILDIEFGQKMYNGVDLKLDQKIKWDRPFAGYLYVSGEFNQYHKNDQVWSLKVELGQVGPLAQGEKVQEVIHDIFNMYHVSGWKDQISNELGVDVGIKYQKLFYRSKNKNFEISAIGSATLGMNHTNTGFSVPIRWGYLRSFDQSVFTKGHVNSQSNSKELFLYYTPSVNFHLYNATLQGGLGKRDPIKELYQIENVIVNHKIGCMVANKKSSFGLSYIFQSTEERKMLYKTHQYGSIFYGLRF
ncbi:lipid A deacylase LpxR family protein [Sphingobacterium sp. SRCM116780]|uniref:lipid A deacylase LpxR family protein n=1 Tax=Sphingobacterium sp. SRCM116780 TaxID=2907623 RepID=UPI001F294215|nr:lipid A deacylase LpxR family protein [Sphingobacterium sp. SRCM116780]UIR56295.1 lipid A deacylase LpxR family protein [Sphingobacterium sp. SRCM116780]